MVDSFMHTPESLFKMRHNDPSFLTIVPFERVAGSMLRWTSRMKVVISCSAIEDIRVLWAGEEFAC